MVSAKPRKRQRYIAETVFYIHNITKTLPFSNSTLGSKMMFKALETHGACTLLVRHIGLKFDLLTSLVIDRP